MADDREIARRSLDLQSRARDFPMPQLPGYMEWSNRKLAEGESDALIANLDATAMWLLPEEAEKITNEDYDEMLEDLKANLKRDRP